MTGVSDAPPTHDNNATPTLSGQGFTITWRAGDASPTFIWNCTYSTNNSCGDSLSPFVMCFLGQHCLPHMTNKKLLCFTDFICVNGHKFHTHPSIYNSGKHWHNHAMVEWHGYAYPLTGSIHAFKDLCQLPPGARITLQELRQPSITATGVYAIIHSFSPLDKDRDFSNTMIGHYKLDCNDKHSMPTLYMVDANNLVAPTIGIRNVGWSKGLCVEEEHFCSYSSGGKMTGYCNGTQ